MADVYLSGNTYAWASSYMMELYVSDIPYDGWTKATNGMDIHNFIQNMADSLPYGGAQHLEVFNYQWYKLGDTSRYIKWPEDMSYAFTWSYHYSTGLWCQLGNRSDAHMEGFDWSDVVSLEGTFNNDLSQHKFPIRPWDGVTIVMPKLTNMSKTFSWGGGPTTTEINGITVDVFSPDYWDLGTSPLLEDLSYCFEAYEPAGYGADSGKVVEFVFSPNMPNTDANCEGMFSRVFSVMSAQNKDENHIRIGDNFYPSLTCNVTKMFYDASDLDRIYCQNWYGGVWGNNYPPAAFDSFWGDCRRLPNSSGAPLYEIGLKACRDYAEGGVFNDEDGVLYYYPTYLDEHGVDVNLMWRVNGDTVNFLQSNQLGSVQKWWEYQKWGYPAKYNTVTGEYDAYDYLSTNDMCTLYYKDCMYADFGKNTADGIDKTEMPQTLYGLFRNFQGLRIDMTNAWFRSPERDWSKRPHPGLDYILDFMFENVNCSDIYGIDLPDTSKWDSGGYNEAVYSMVGMFKNAVIKNPVWWYDLRGGSHYCVDMYLGSKTPIILNARALNDDYPNEEGSAVYHYTYRANLNPSLPGGDGYVESEGLWKKRIVGYRSFHEIMIDAGPDYDDWYVAGVFAQSSCPTIDLVDLSDTMFKREHGNVISYLYWFTGVTANKIIPPYKHNWWPTRGYNDSTFSLPNNLPQPTGRDKGIDNSYCKLVEDGGYFTEDERHWYYYPTNFDNKGLWFKYDNTTKDVCFSTSRIDDTWSRWGYPKISDYDDSYDHDKPARDMSYRFYADAQTVSTYGGEIIYPPTEVPGLFRGCKLGDDFNLDNWDFYKYGVDDASYMFAESTIPKITRATFGGNGGPTSIGLKDYTARSTFEAMFKNCTYLKTFDISRFVAEPLTMQEMFSGCTTLTSVKINDANSALSNYLNGSRWFVDLDEMFYGCSSLKTLNLEAMRWKAGINANQTFAACPNLEHIYVSINYSDWTAEEREYRYQYYITGENTFAGDTKLSAYDGTIDNTKCKLIAELGYFESVEPYYPLYYWLEKVSVVGQPIKNVLHLSNTKVTSDYKAWAYNEQPWRNYNGYNRWDDNVEEVITDGESLVVPPDIRNIFYDCVNLTTIDTTKWDTQFVERLGQAFCGCTNLEIIQGIDNWDVNKVYDLQGMFWQCESLKDLNLKNWQLCGDTTKSIWGYASCYRMFKQANISNLQIGAKTFNNVKDTREMFYNITGDRLNLSAWSPEHFEYYKDMFSESYQLKKIYVSNTPANGRWIDNVFNDASVVMFNGSSSLPSFGDTTATKAKPVTMGGYFYNVVDLYTWYDTSTGELHLSNHKLTDDYELWDAPSVPTIPKWRNATKLVNDEASSYNNLKFPLDPSYLLYECNNLGNWGLDGDAEHWDMTNCESLRQVFPYPCEEISYWMLSSCEEIYYPFNTGRAPEGVGTSLSLNNWVFGYDRKTSPIKKIEGLVNNPGVKHIQWNGMSSSYDALPEVLYIKDAFKGCTDLESAYVKVQLGKGEIHNCEEVSGMFDGCTSLKTVNLILMNGFAVSDFSRMFKNCSSLDVPTLTFSAVDNVVEMEEMFSGCSSLRSLDISNWYIGGFGCDCTKMFSDCANLKQIYVNTDFPPGGDWESYIAKDTDMFANSPKLPDYNPAEIGGSKAKLVSQGGYFWGVDDLVHWWYKWNWIESNPDVVTWNDGHLHQKQEVIEFTSKNNFLYKDGESVFPVSPVNNSSMSFKIGADEYVLTAGVDITFEKHIVEQEDGWNIVTFTSNIQDEDLKNTLNNKTLTISYVTDAKWEKLYTPQKGTGLPDPIKV